MSSKVARFAGRYRRQRRVRKRVRGSGLRPRLSVFRSGKHIYAQVIDDSTGCTLAAASSLDAELRTAGVTGCAAAKQVGLLVARRALEKGIDRVVFDRNGYLYHGRVKAVAEGAREGELEL